MFTGKQRAKLVQALALLAALGLWAGAASAQAPKRTVEVLVFKGGYGSDFFEDAAKQFEAAHPDIQVTVQGDPRAWDLLIPRLASGTPPDLVWPGWGMNLTPVISEGQIMPWDKYLDKPAWGDTSGKKWRDTFQPNLLANGVFDGQSLVLPFNIDSYGWWYDKKLFEKHGWALPTTYEEFLVLAEKIKAEGIAPITFQGRYPEYLENGIFYPWVISAGGMDAFNALMDKKPDAWLHPAVLRAAQAVMDCKKNGIFQRGCIGMNHIEAQMELLVHRAAFIPCGSWLQQEMKDVIPKTMELTFLKTPVFKDGPGDPTALYMAPDGKGFLLPAKAKNPDDAAEFYRFLSSPEKVKEFTERKGALTAITPSSDPKMPRYLEGPYQAFTRANVTWSNVIADWDRELQTEIDTGLADMYNEVHTPQEFVRRINAKAEAYRAKLQSNGKGN